MRRNRPRKESSSTETEREGFSRYIPIIPHPKQREFMGLRCKEALYGGAAGGGKSFATLATALQFVETPGYAALIIRRRLMDLVQPGALIPISHEWLRGTDAHWDGQRYEWRFPSGAKLVFGYLDNPRDLDRYQGGAYHLVAFDELTQHSESNYRYLFSRTRRPSSGPLGEIPTMFRNTANPGGIGHAWVKKRFLEDGVAKGRVFVSARLPDNPSLDIDEYRASLAELDPVRRQQLEDGDWDAVPDGEFFVRDWFRIVEPSDVPRLSEVRYYDMAATVPHAGNRDPDWTVGARVGLADDGRIFVRHIQRVRQRPAQNETMMLALAHEDGRAVRIYEEQEPGSAGVSVIAARAAKLVGFAYEGVRSTGAKRERAVPLAAAAKNGLVHLVRGTWNSDFLDEACAFPIGHDDQVDAVSGALAVLKPRASTDIRAGHRRRTAGLGRFR